MAKSTSTCNNFLALVYNATAWANIADNAASSPTTNVYVALSTASYTVSSTMSTTEATYTNYARQAVANMSIDIVVTGTGLTTSNVGNAVFSAIASANNDPGTMGYLLNNASSVTLASGTAQAGTSTTITLDTGSSSIDDTYNYNIIAITGGTGSGQAAFITDYVGSTRVATISTAWVTNPSASSTFKILPLGIKSIKDMLTTPLFLGLQ